MSEGRSPYGERGLKCNEASPEYQRRMSLSLRRAWIEITPSVQGGRYGQSRSPYGERGLKCQDRSAGYRRCQVALLTESVD